MKWQEHSQISLLAGSGSAALSDFEHEGKRRRAGTAVWVCPASRCPVCSGAELGSSVGVPLVNPVTSVMKPCMATVLADSLNLHWSCCSLSEV